MHRLIPVLLAAGSLLPAQETAADTVTLANGFRLVAHPVESSSHCALVLVLRPDVPPGMGHDTVLAELLRAAEPEITASARDRYRWVQQRGSSLWLVEVVPADLRDPILDHWVELLSREAWWDEDGFLQARGRARLAADDWIAVLPGSLLLERAQAALLPGDPRGRLELGDPEAMGGLAAPEVERGWERARSPAAATLVAIGAGCGDGFEDAVRARFGALPVPPAEAAADRVERVDTRPSDALPALLAERESLHPDVTAPYASLAFRAREESSEFAAFLVAMEALRGRLQVRDFGDYRGGELSGNAPHLAYDPLNRPGVALIHRRGIDRDPIQKTRGEVDSVVAKLRRFGLSEAEVELGRRTVAVQLAPPPWTAPVRVGLERSWRALIPRVQVLAAYATWGWDPELVSQIRTVSVTEVNRVLQECLDPAQVVPLGLRGRPRKTMEELLQKRRS